ncbi:putative enterotoxin [Ophiocordyceps camponoti-floridani]|uniref:Putative enterotoxin n=1 Tax=Ophiocordyceps camponoti-floridani TaxID=2030778 RepID=A0A8H4VEF3_9HYPO|nr:putative enterotoxin [Ophiocordyceps camponoti-floridani]
MRVTGAVLALLYLQWPGSSHAGSCFGKCCAAIKPAKGPLVFRVDSRTPQQIKEAQGFWPRGTDFSIYKHAEKHSPNSAYVSTSERAAGGAEIFAVPPPPRGSGLEKKYKGCFLYAIHPAENFVNTRLSLGPYSTHRERELLAAGGIRWDQIRGWTYLGKGRDTPISERRFVVNKDYDVKRWRGHVANPEPQYQLAGFPKKMDTNNPRAPKEHPWTQDSWKDFEKQGEAGVRQAGIQFMQNHGRAFGITKVETCPDKQKIKRQAGPIIDCWRTQDGDGEADEELGWEMSDDPAAGSEAESELAELDDPLEEEAIMSVTNKVAETELYKILTRFKLDKTLANLKLSPSQLRARFRNYEPLAALAKPKALAQKAKRIGRGILTVGVLNLYVKDLIDVFTGELPSAVEKAAVVTSVVPVVGCLTSGVLEDKAGDATACVFGDLLLFTPWWPIGIGIHVTRFLKSLLVNLFRGSINADPQHVWEKEEAFQYTRRKEFSLYWNQIVHSFSSQDFMDKVLEPQFDAETAGYAFAATQAVGLVHAARDVARRAGSNRTLVTDADVLMATLPIYEAMCRSIRERSHSIVKEKQKMARMIARDQAAKFDRKFAHRVERWWHLRARSRTYRDSPFSKSVKRGNNVTHLISWRLQKAMAYNLTQIDVEIARHAAGLKLCRVNYPNSSDLTTWRPGRSAADLVQVVEPGSACGIVVP